MKNHLPGIHSLTDFAQAKIILLFSGVFTTGQYLMNTYVFNHSGWVQAIMIAVCIDTITGVWKSIKNRTFNSYNFGSLMIKAIVYALFVFVLGGLWQVEHETSKLIANLGYSAILFREALSVVENIEDIRPGSVPAWITDKLKKESEGGGA